MYIQNDKYKQSTHEYSDNNYTHAVLGALLILLLSIYSDAVRSLIPEQTITFFFNKSVYTKYIILFASIYFLIDFTYKNKKSPLFEVSLSVIIMILFIMYTKIHYTLNIVIFILLGVIYFINDMIVYKKTQQFDSNNTIYSKNSLLYTVKNNLIIVCFLLLIIGYSMYICS
jgi:hypothetical protein